MTRRGDRKNRPKRPAESLRKAIAEARQANRFLDAIIENIPHMVFVKDAENLRFVRFNRAGETLLGIARKDLIGKSDYDFFPESEAAFFQTKDRETLKDGALSDIPEEPIDTKTGRRWLHTKKVPILDSSGTPAYLLGISEDITERKQMEEARSRLAVIVDSSDDAIFSQSFDGAIATWNGAAERLFGFAADEIVGKLMWVLIPERHRDGEASIFERLKNGERIEPYETVRTRRDGSEVEVWVTLSLIKDQSGGTIGISTIARDFTEMKRIQRALVEAKDAAETAGQALQQAQKLQALGRLAAGVAHHFNNLLTVVIGNLEEGMARESAAGRTSDPMLAVALRAALRGAGLTRQLLSFSRQQLLQPEIIEPSERLADTGLLFAASLRKDIIIETDVPEDLWPIAVDPAELELALLNLAMNARDAMPAGGVLRLTAANETIEDGRRGLAGPYLVIELRDNGTGIPPEILPRVFDPFFTTKDVGSGSGLGLSQVHGFAHQSGGTVDIDSTLGKGTTVRLYLPASPGARQAARAVEAPTHRRAGEGTILVVEDDADVAALAAESLRHRGFRVKLAHRAEAALDLLSEGEPVDLIFSDIVMPGQMNGLELAEAVRARFPTIPVLLTTGHSDAVRDAARRGLQIVAKPYRLAEICDRVTKLIQATAAERRDAI
jgi:PAS domain S-box-containing protein